MFFCRLNYTVTSEKFFYTMKNPSLANANDLSITQIINLEHEAFAPIMSLCYGSLIIKNEQYMFKS